MGFLFIHIIVSISQKKEEKSEEFSRSGFARFFNYCSTQIFKSDTKCSSTLNYLGHSIGPSAFLFFPDQLSCSLKRHQCDTENVNFPYNIFFMVCHQRSYSRSINHTNIKIPLYSLQFVLGILLHFLFVIFISILHFYDGLGLSI